MEGDFKHAVDIYDARLFKTETGKPAIAIIMEFGGRSLERVLRASNVKGDHSDLKKITYNLLCSLNYLHSCGIMHRDIKPSNIIIGKGCTISLCDFGLARTVPESALKFNLK